MFVMYKLTVILAAVLFLAEGSQLEGLVRLRGGTCGKTPMTLEPDFFEACDSIGLSCDTCSTAWEEFTAAFAFKNPAEVQGR